MPRQMAQAVGTWNPGWMGHWDLQSQHRHGMLMPLLMLHSIVSLSTEGIHVQAYIDIYMQVYSSMHYRAVESSLALSSQCVSDLTPSSYYSIHLHISCLYVFQYVISI